MTASRTAPKTRWHVSVSMAHVINVYKRLPWKASMYCALIYSHDRSYSLRSAPIQMRGENKQLRRTIVQVLAELVVILKEIVEWALNDLFLEQVALIEEENKRRVLEPLATSKRETYAQRARTWLPVSF